MRTDDAIALRDVGFTVNGISILSSIDLTVSQGDFLIILGPNGAGKTTLLKLIDGFIKPTSGSIELLGQTLRSDSVKSLRRRMAYLPQDMTPDLRIPISVWDVVSIGRLAHKPVFGRLTSDDRLIVHEAIEAVGIVDLTRHPFGHLSAGQKQKVSLARALAQEADIMLLDEPLSNLDPRAQRDVCDTIDRIYGSTGKTILLVTHLLESIPGSATRALLLKNGSIAGRVPIGRISEAGFRRDLYSTLPEVGSPMKPMR
jgi:ABC-type Mn2+/Zn2+ transport system ATPase subunit